MKQFIKLSTKVHLSNEIWKSVETILLRPKIVEIFEFSVSTPYNKSIRGQCFLAQCESLLWRSRTRTRHSRRSSYVKERDGLRSINFSVIPVPFSRTAPVILVVCWRESASTSNLSLKARQTHSFEWRKMFLCGVKVTFRQSSPSIDRFFYIFLIDVTLTNLCVMSRFSPNSQFYNDTKCVKVFPQELF